jgi:hypothetical protein
MNISIPSIKQNLTCILLSALVGAVLATGIVFTLVSGNIGAIQLSQWQIAAVYVVAIVASVLIGMKRCDKNCDKKNSPAVTDAGNTESKQT